jgi:NADH-quinone oxidoreductase subunit A
VADSVYPLLMMLGVAMTVASSMLVLSALLGRPDKRLAKAVDMTPYECGARPFEAVERHRFSVKFYLVAMLFILFDIETAFLVPWAATFQSFTGQKVFVLVEMGVFLGMLAVGYLYVWWRGALEWD